MSRPTGGKKYFEAMGRSFASRGRSMPPEHYFMHLPYWSLDAFDIGVAYQRRESVRKFLQRTATNTSGSQS